MTPRPWEPEAVALRRAERRQKRALLIVAATTAIVVLFAVVVAIVADDDDGNGQAGATTQDSTPSTTAARSTTTAGRSTTTSGGSTTTTDRSGGSSTSIPAATTTPAANSVVPTTASAPTTGALPSPVPPTEGEPTTAPTTATPTPTVAPGTLDNPVPVRTAAPIGEGWSLSVNSYTPDATAAVMAEDEFSESPDDGFQFALVSVAVTYTGSDPTASMVDVYMDVISPDDLDTYMFFCAAPQELDMAADVAPGETVVGNVCFQVPTATATRMVMVALGGFDTEEETYFALT